jgi:hypothetical protein
MRKKYYVAINDDVIFGIGTSKRKARLDARRWIQPEKNDGVMPPIEIRETTEEFYRHIEANGYDGRNDVFVVKNGLVVNGKK